MDYPNKKDISFIDIYDDEVATYPRAVTYTGTVSTDSQDSKVLIADSDGDGFTTNFVEFGNNVAGFEEIRKGYYLFDGTEIRKVVGVTPSAQAITLDSPFTTSYEGLPLKVIKPILLPRVTFQNTGAVDGSIYTKTSPTDQTQYGSITLKAGDGYTFDSSTLSAFVIDSTNTTVKLSNAFFFEVGASGGGGGGGTWGSITGTLSAQTDLQTALDVKVDENAAITGATKTKITYDAKGLITAGADATTADISASTDKNYVTDAQLVVIGNTSGTNSGNETASSIGSIVNGASVATPNNTDLVATVESSVVKKITWTNVKAFLKTYFDSIYQAVLVSGTSIKTINSTSLLGSGDIAITGNATHTGEVTGSGVLTVDKTAISNKTVATIVGTDYLLFGDTSDSDNLKKGSVSDIVALSGSTQYGGNNTLYVSKQGSDATGTKGDRSKPYLTIQTAINAAVDGDVVLVMEGTYVENLALKDSVKLISETWGAATIQHDTITDSWGISSPDITVLGSGIYNEIFITGFRITNPQMEPTIKIKAKKLTVKLAYLEVKSKNVSYQSKIQLYPSSTSAGVFECDIVDINSISNVTQFGFDGAASDVIGAVYAVPTCHIKVCNFTEITTQPQDYIGWQNWDWRIDAVNSNTINAGGGFGEMYHQNCNGHVGIYRSIRTGSQGNNSTVFFMPTGNQTLTIDYFYSEGQERIISCGEGNNIINIGWMQTDGLIFIGPAAGKTTILNAQTIKRVNSKATAIFYIFPTGANGKVKLNCNYAESNGSGSGVIYTYNSSNVALDIYLSGEFYNSNSTNSLVIQDDANATVKYKVIGSLILRNNQSAATKFYGSFAYNRNFYIVGGMGVTNSATGAGTVTTVTGSIQTDTGL